MIGRLRTRRGLVFVAAMAVLIAGCTTTAVLLTRDEQDAVAGDDNPLLEATSSTRAPTTRPQASTSTTLAPLPVPDPPPDNPYADVPIIEIGSISIPKINVLHPLYEGVWLTVLNEGPGHWPNSAMPGQRGNTVFPGHRTTHSRPFHNLDLLAPGDEVTFHMPEADYTYSVRETLIVVPTDLWVVDQTETPTFTLVACHPKGSARQRIVVKGDLIRTTPKAATA